MALNSMHGSFGNAGRICTAQCCELGFKTLAVPSDYCRCITNFSHMDNYTMSMTNGLHEHAVSTKGEDDVGCPSKEVVDRPWVLVAPGFSLESILDAL